MLPEDWHKPESIVLTQDIGNTWLADTAVLRVPSVIIPEEVNYVLNPHHSGFHKIKFGPSLPFKFDARLK